MRQDLFETLYSQRNIHEILHRSVTYELNKTFLTWSIGAYMRINAYLEGEYYDSKNKRLRELREYVSANGLDELLTATLVSCIRAKRDQPIQAIIGYLQKFLPHDDHFDRARTAGEIIALCSGTHRLFSIERPVADEAPLVVVNHWDLLLELFSTELDWIDDMFYNPPLVEKPKEVRDNHSCGYHTINEPVILGTNTQHQDSVDLPTLNNLNQIPWLLDPIVRTLPAQPPATLSTGMDIDNFIKHREQANSIYNVLGSNPFFLVWQFDSRGRVYSHGHHVNFQSYEYKKVMLSFDDYQVLT